ncbi:MAG: arginine deiminase-related protein, partial [Candidatus Poribacteria bacterium]|nr:arginine deiminase-related protein [Candidatus Poribacteria bacterium]
LPDMVFTANAGLVYGSRAILSNFRYNERQGEAEHFQRWFEKHGYSVEMLPTKHAFEGEGDALFVGDHLFVGYRFRTDVHAHRLIGEMLGLQVLSLHLVDAYFYHLDTCFCSLGPDVAAYYPPAFDAYAQQVLKANIPRLLEVSEEDARRFAANAVVVGKNVIINAGCDAFQRTLEAEGFRVYAVNLSQFLLAGGSAKCLVLHLPARSDKGENSHANSRI